MPASEGIVKVENGHRLFYRSVGDGPQAVLIPLATWWGTQAEKYLADRNLVLYDTRGRGRSDPLTEDLPLGFSHDVADLEAIRTHLGIERLSVMGWSYLGAMAILYAHAYPEVVERVVQVGPLMLRRGPLWDQWLTSYAERTAELAESGKADSALLRESSPDASSETFDPRAGLKATILPQLGRLSAADAILDTVGVDLPNEHPDALGRWFERNAAALGDWDLTVQAAEIRAPVLTVHGTKDNIPLAASEEWVATLPNARLLRMDGIGHYPFFEAPEEFFGAVRAFLDEP